MSKGPSLSFNMPKGAVKADRKACRPKVYERKEKSTTSQTRDLRASPQVELPLESNYSISTSYEYELCLILYNVAVILDNLMFFLLLSFYFENLLIYNVPSNFCHIKLSITKLYRIHSSLYQIR